SGKTRADELPYIAPPTVATGLFKKITLILKTKDLLKLILKTKGLASFEGGCHRPDCSKKNNVDPENKGLTEVDPENKGVTSRDPENKGVSLFPHSSPKAG